MEKQVTLINKTPYPQGVFSGVHGVIAPSVEVGGPVSVPGDMVDDLLAIGFEIEAKAKKETIKNA